MILFTCRNTHNFFGVMVRSHWLRPRPRLRLIPVPMEFGSMIKMLESGYSGPRPMQISIVSVHISLVPVSVTVSGSVNQS